MKRIEHIELYVASLPLALDFYKRTFQCVPLAYLNQHDQSSILIQHGSIRLILTSSSKPSNRISRFIHLHGDGVKDIAFLTDNVVNQFELAIKSKVRPILEPTIYETTDGKIQKATVSAFGDISHTFIQRDIKNSVALPFYQPFANTPAINPTLLEHIDHLAICVNRGDLAYWIEHYKTVYGFYLSHEESVITENSGMNSGVVQSPDGLIKIVFTEPVPGVKRSQIEEFLTFFPRRRGSTHCIFNPGYSVN